MCVYNEQQCALSQCLSVSAWLSVAVRACVLSVWNVGVSRDSRDSPDEPQRDRDPADVSRAKQVTDVVALPLLRVEFFLWGGRA